MDFDKNKIESVKKEFLVALGEYLYDKREHKGYSLKSVGKAIGVSYSTLERYEKGEIPMRVDKLPLLSSLYGFELKDCFEEIMKTGKLDAFGSGIIVLAHKYHRDMLRPIRFSEERMVTIITPDGQEVEGVVKKKKTHKVSYRETLLAGKVFVEEEPFSDIEMELYLMEMLDRVDKSVVAALDLIKSMDGLNGNETLKGPLAKYVMNELIIEPMVSYGYDVSVRRAYAYYKKHLNQG